MLVAGSMVGVPVMPISGVTWPPWTGSDGTSPGPSIDTFQIEGAGVGVVGIEAVVLGGDIQDVVRPLAGDRHVGDV